VSHHGNCGNGSPVTPPAHPGTNSVRLSPGGLGALAGPGLASLLGSGGPATSSSSSRLDYNTR